MPSVDKPCFLLPHGSDRSAVYVCIPVDSGLAKRSPVIETLMEFEGLVDMPEGVSFDDFEAWSAMHTDDPTRLDDEELSFALQVGEKLSAHATDKLAQALASRVKKVANRSACCPQSILRAVLPLSRNLQQLVFRHIGRISAPDLLSWPIDLQQAFSNLWVSQKSRDFTIDGKLPQESVGGLLTLLARTDPALPRLRSFSIYCHIASTSTAALLSQALLHHSPLTHLYAPYLSWSPAGSHATAAAMVFRTVPRLTALTALTLCCSVAAPPSAMTAPRADAAMDTAHALAAAISELPLLASFHLQNQGPGITRAHLITANAAKAVKRRRIESYLGRSNTHAGRLTIDPVIAALSTAPALTALCFTYTAASTVDELPCSGIRGPFNALRRLHLQMNRDTKACPDALCTLCPTSSLVHIEPLPALRSLTFESATSGSDGAFIEAVLASAARQPGLQNMRVEYDCSGASAFGFHLPPDPTEACAPSGRLYPRCVLSPSIALSATGVRAIAAGLARMPSLVAFVAEFSDTEPAAGSAWRDDEVADAHGMLLPLSELAHLRDIAVYGSSPASGHAMDAICSAVLHGPLASLTGMTSVMLGFPVSGVAMDVLGQHIQSLVHLKDLSVEDIHSATAAGVKACLSPLTALTTLEIFMRPVDGGIVCSFAESLMGMPQLQTACLESCDGPETNSAASQSQYASSDWMEGLLQLPCRGEFSFGLCNDAVDEGVAAGIRQKLILRGARVSDVCRFVSFDSACDEEEKAVGTHMAV